MKECERIERNLPCWEKSMSNSRVTVTVPASA